MIEYAYKVLFSSECYTSSPLYDVYIIDIDGYASSLSAENN